MSIVFRADEVVFEGVAIRYHFLGVLGLITNFVKESGCSWFIWYTVVLRVSFCMWIVIF